MKDHRALISSKLSIIKHIGLIIRRIINISSIIIEIVKHFREINSININLMKNITQQKHFKCGENRNHGKFKIYFLMVEL